jgi:hypothetical protein
MPDFDIDFDDARRGEVIKYVTEKYGTERVAQIATFGRLKAKAAIKDAARVLDHGFAISDRITKALPADVMGKGVALKDIFDPQHKRYNEGGEFRALHDSDPDVRTIFHTALGLEGQIRNWGVHAAGVIMSSEPIIDVVPIMARPQDGAVITQFDYPMCESLGLVKMDFLGLSNLRILEDALANIQVNRDETVVLEELGFEDRATYELMGRGDTLGVFQLDGSGMRSLLRSGSDPFASNGRGGPTPVSLAGRMAETGRAPKGSTARLLLLAAGRWSPVSHELFPEPARWRAVELMRLGWLLSREARFCGEEQALVDIWRSCVLPLAVTRNEAGAKPSGSHDSVAKARSRRWEGALRHRAAVSS